MSHVACGDSPLKETVLSYIWGRPPLAFFLDFEREKIVSYEPYRPGLYTCRVLGILLYSRDRKGNRVNALNLIAAIVNLL